MTIIEFVSILLSSGTLAAAIFFVFKFGNWYGQVNSDRDAFKQFMEEVRADVKNILNRLPSSDTTSKASPIKLNDLGEKLSVSLKVDAWVEDVAENILIEAENMDAFQVQEFCFDFARKYQYAPDLEKQIRASAFEEGISLTSVHDVFGVMLRDKVLAHHDKELSD